MKTCQGNRVHITSENGTLLFDRLIDDGSNAMRFESGFGFVAKDELLNGEKIVIGWHST
jgi:hypothetical protein